MEVGDEVVRVKGEKFQLLDRGTVAEKSGDRLRVAWRDKVRPGVQKRTWVNVSVVRPAEPVAEAATMHARLALAHAELSAALDAVRRCADAALADAREGRASYTSLLETIQKISRLAHQAESEGA